PTQEVASLPDMKVSIRQLFGFDSDMEVPAYSEADEHVPDIDPDYRFDKPTTLAILAGFAHNRRVIVTGYHGTGKSPHIEQVAARLTSPCHPAAAGLPASRYREHPRPRRHPRARSRHAADQPAADGPLVDRHHAQFSAPRQRSRHRAGQGQALAPRPGPRHRQQDGAG